MKFCIPAHSPTPVKAPAVYRGRRFARPKMYTPGLCKRICNRIMLGETLTSICNEPDMPAKVTIAKWLADPRMVDFRNEYYNARRIQAELRVDEAFDIADDCSRDWIEEYDRDGNFLGYKPDNEAIQRSKLRVDTRKWFAGKMLPRLYGENSQVDIGVTGDLAALLKKASNQHTGLPPKPAIIDNDTGEFEDDE